MRIQTRRKFENRRVLIEQLERRHLLAASPFGTNPLQPLDVSRDGIVSPLDALRVINAVARNQDGDGIADPADNVGNFIDVTGDGIGTTLDALRVINALGRGAPIIAATLPNDSGPAGQKDLALDLRTNDYSIDLSASGASLGDRSVELSIFSASFVSVDITNQFSDGRAAFTQEQIDQLYGRPLSDGDYRFAVSIDGSDRGIDFVLTVDRSAPELSLLSPIQDGDHSVAARILGAINDENMGGPVTVLVTYHPAYLLRAPSGEKSCLGRPSIDAARCRSNVREGGCPTSTIKVSSWRSCFPERERLKSLEATKFPRWDSKVSP